MATIKAIEVKSVHQIQSGQVIVDLCSVVKELLENALDADATAIEIRFKNNGLDAIEVQDNGNGIEATNYNNIALKHYTSKLSSFDDLSDLQTFGFRGEALSSLCALSQLSIVTATTSEAPKGNRLDFERSGSLKSTTTIAAQKGTTVFVENIFDNLPVRRKELTKNVKREYGKVLGLLHAYACVSVNVKITVKNAMPKSKSMIVFATKGNQTTRENIANIYGAKTLSALVALDLTLSLQPQSTSMSSITEHHDIKLLGHISKPVFGEGRQAPDRQMFFVNGRPCGLPQIAKAINEVYRSFNASQSPFIFADFIMDTSSYDVNVSPDKRTILIHDASNLTETLKANLEEMFDAQEQTVPQSQLQHSKLPAYRQLSIPKLQQNNSSTESADGAMSPVSKPVDPENDVDSEEPSSLSNRFSHDHFQNIASTREELDDDAAEKLRNRQGKEKQRKAEKFAKLMSAGSQSADTADEYDDVTELVPQKSSIPLSSPLDPHVRDFNERMQGQAQATTAKPDSSSQDLASAPSSPSELTVSSIVQTMRRESSGIVQNAFDRIRPRRAQAEIATITIGNETVTKVIGSNMPKLPQFATIDSQSITSEKQDGKRQDARSGRFSQSLRRFGANLEDEASDEGKESVGENDDSDRETLDETNDSPQGSLSGSIESENGDQDSVNADKLFDDLKQTKAKLHDADNAQLEIQEDMKVDELIRLAEKNGMVPSKENSQRLNKALKGGQTKDSTCNLLATIDTNVEEIQHQMQVTNPVKHNSINSSVQENDEFDNEESRLSLTISRSDFARMRIVGQFNLGFILVVRPATDKADYSHATKDEFFIIDQHASDEKFNFERLQASTIVGTQTMVRPVDLDLNAMEEEIIIENVSALEKNGFVVDVNDAEDVPIGKRCKLVSLPLSKEVTFDMRDFEELLHLLAENPYSSSTSTIPRPSKVRKMFAMRACRSSIMIGRALSQKQMSTVVKHMGTIDKPWNCPHGRPTMRHLASLNSITTWQEGDGLTEASEKQNYSKSWNKYIAP